MPFFDWYYALEALVAKEAREEKEDARERMPRLNGPPYRHADEEPEFGTETVEEPFVAAFRSSDGTVFTCCAIAVFEAPSVHHMTEAMRKRVTGCLTDRLMKEGGFNAAISILVTVREFVRAVCLGVSHPPKDVMGLLDPGVRLADVRLYSVTVDSDVGRPVVFRFDR